MTQVGERQQRLLRELEKLALEGDQGGERARVVSVQEIEGRAAHSAEWRAYGLADALVGGDSREATLTYLRLREQGERLSGLLYLMASRLRDALAISLRLQGGESVAEIKRGLRMPARAAERFVADVARTSPTGCAGRSRSSPTLELDSRGGAPLPREQDGGCGIGEDTIALRAIEAITRLGDYSPAERTSVRAARDFLRAPVFCAARRA